MMASSAENVHFADGQNMHLLPAIAAENLIFIVLSGHREFLPPVGPRGIIMLAAHFRDREDEMQIGDQHWSKLVQTNCQSYNSFFDKDQMICINFVLNKLTRFPRDSTFCSIDLIICTYFKI
uniref:Uncharacterized protein n=1 Tax=Romanomermis culicivorax TaxID=13658 RepID=A0A915KYJ0_ROMCU